MPRHARQVVREATKAAAKAQAKSEADGKVAYRDAESKAYRILSWKLKGSESFPKAWRLYRPQDEWAKHMFRPVANDYGRNCVHSVTFEDGDQEMNHYGSELMGVVCGGAGWAMACVLRDTTTNVQTVYAIAGHGTRIGFAECPGVTAADFSTKDDVIGDRISPPGAVA